MSCKLFTIGHSTHTVERFINLLQTHDVSTVFDVRSMPYSRYNPQFNRESLKRSLQEQDISYVFLGNELGARSKNPDDYRDGKVQYERLARGQLFKDGIYQLKKEMENNQVALMCAEKDPLTCHRTILICKELRDHELDIFHILDDGGLESNSAAEKRLMKMFSIEPDLIRAEQDCIEEAYCRQENNIAYEASGTNA